MAEYDNSGLQLVLPQKWFRNTKLSDVVLVCSGGAGQRVSFPAHRFALWNLSAKFAELFDADPTQREFDMLATVDELGEFLKFFYKQSVVLTMANIDKVLQLVEDYGNKTFMATCFVFLLNESTAHNLAWTYGLALRHALPRTIKRFETKIAEQAGAVLGSAAFLECKHEVVLRILRYFCAAWLATKSMF